MDISWEKAEIIRRFNQVNDTDLIKAIRDLLDLGLNKQKNNEIALKASIDRAINES